MIFTDIFLMHNHCNTIFFSFRFLSFTPEKDTYETMKNQKSPVKLINARITPKHGSNELIISRSSSLQIAQNLNFTCIQTTDTTPITIDKLENFKTPGKVLGKTHLNKFP